MTAFPNLKKKNNNEDLLFRFLLLSEIRKDTCMLSADELKFIFLCMLPSKGDTKYIFFSRTSPSFSDPSEALQSLPTYFKGAFFYLALPDA